MGIVEGNTMNVVVVVVLWFLFVSFPAFAQGWGPEVFFLYSKHSTLYGMQTKGHAHPVSIIIRDIITVATSLGFDVTDGPELEQEKYNFDMLNIPSWHPARDMWDTFWVKTLDGYGKRLMRTHTSSVQPRYMSTHQPPFSVMIPGKVFRYEPTDTTHEAQFFQLEGFMVGTDVSVATMKAFFAEFFSKLFKKDIHVRMRPSYFPFVEPGVEVDMSCFKCGGAGCATCKHTGWIEIMGAGMIHPTVLRDCHIDPDVYSGFAFGVGIDRIIMMKYGIDDIRVLYNGDIRVSAQF